MLLDTSSSDLILHMLALRSFKGEATAAIPWPQKRPRNPKGPERGRSSRSESQRKKPPTSCNQQATPMTSANELMEHGAGCTVINPVVHVQLPS